MQKHKLTEREILEFLNDIETGDVTLTPKSEPQHTVHCEYEASNGWGITIFNDAGAWDYIHEVRKGGQILDFSRLSRFFLGVNSYHPSDEVAWKRYGIPGHLTFRCKPCGRNLGDRATDSTPLICDKCSYKKKRRQHEG